MSDPTDADIRAYNERRARLRSEGLRVPPDLYGQDELDDEADPTGALRFYERVNAENDAAIAAEIEDRELFAALERDRPKHLDG